MASWLARSVLAVGLTFALVGCAPVDGDDPTEEAAGELNGTSAERVVRAYYAAARSERPAAGLAPIVADGAVLSAPSVRILKGTPQVEGKDAFIKAVDGGAFLIGKASIREIVVQGPNLAIARIELPLPNRDTLTQVEYFTLENGKIKRLDSYYDSLRFTAALPAIAWDRLRHALGI